MVPNLSQPITYHFSDRRGRLCYSDHVSSGRIGTLSYNSFRWRAIRQSLLSLHMTKSYVRTATRSTLKVEANLTQILNFKANFHTEFEPFFKKKIYANNGGHFKIVSIKIKN